MLSRVKRSIRYGILTLFLVGGGLVASASNPDFILGRNLQILFNMYRELNLIYVDPVDSDKMLRAAAEGMTADLDPYTEFIPESEMAQFEMETTGKYAGIGALVRRRGDYVEISQPYRGFPADKAGLVIGDKLIIIDGKDMKGAEVSTVSAMLKGDPGTVLRLRVHKMLTGDTVDLTLRRELVTISGVSYYGKVSDSIGYIVHDRFTDECSNDIRKAFAALRKEGIKGLVIDLRGNGGGILQEAVKIMALFVPKGTEVVSMRGRMSEMDAVFRTQSEPVDTKIPIVLLVDNQSASSSEILAGAFQDLDRGVLLGQRTFGKGLVQTPRPLGFNTYLKVTTAKYYIPSGRCIQAVDYAHRTEEGKIDLVPDSLIREFRTVNDRKVYDGGGVMPDVKVDPREYVSNFSIAVYLGGYVEDFANDFYRRNRTAVDVDHFGLSDADYADFLRFMENKEVDYESETQQLAFRLREKATQEKYLDLIAAELDAIDARVKEDKAADLQRFRAELSRMLEDEILLRYHYTEGVSRHRTFMDTELQAAVELLSDPVRYREILLTRDTDRR